MIRSSFLFLFLFVIGISSAQTTDQNLEWKALNFLLNNDYDHAIRECSEILEIHKDDLVSNRARFILARSLMETNRYDEAITVLNKTELHK